MTKNSRRQILRTGVAGIAVLSVKGTVAMAATPAAKLLRAEITLGGRKFEFREELGRDLGNFVSPIGGFTQGCIRTDVSGCPITVFFRPDRTSDRTEVVFELGKVFNSAPADLGKYVVTIFRGITAIATIDVPAHYWFSRWRWQSDPRPIVGNVDTLIAQNLLPPYDREASLDAVSAGTSVTVLPAVTDACPAPPSPATPPPIVTTPVIGYSVMGLAGINAYMPQTGERPDIGIVTEAQAEYICTSRETALERLRAQAEAAGTMPWHIRDEVTNMPLNLYTYPGATWYSSTTNGTPYVKDTKTPITLDSAHQPALSYVPYLLTGDPYHLEDLQFQANWNLGTIVREYRFTIPQSRTFAWNLRSLAQSARITPATVPSWLLPRQYWIDFLGEYRRFFEADYVNSQSPERAIFRATREIANSADEGPTAPKATWVDPWGDEFVAVILGWVVAMGFTEWQKSFDWKISSTIARTNRTSGWKRAHATPYRLILRETATAPFANNWTAAWNLTQRIGKLTYSDPNTWVPSDMTYLGYTRGALVYIDKLKTWDVAENLSWATAQLNARKWPIPYKWRLGKGLA
jgi:hypothetical protein